MNLIKSNQNLPATVEEIHKFLLVGKESLIAQKAKIRAIERVGDAHAAKSATLLDTQDLAEVLLDAEAKLGEMLAVIPDYHSSGKGTMKRKELPLGITKKESHFAQQIQTHPEIVETTKAKAREEARVVTSREVLKEIQKEKQRQQQPAPLSEMPKDKWQTIVIDPPWPIKKILREERPIQDVVDYTPLTIEQIGELSISEIAADNCHIYLWTTHKFLPDAFDILEGWGFKYQCL